MFNEQDLNNKLKGRLSKTEVLYYAADLHNDEDGISRLCDIMLNEEGRHSVCNAAWILSHLSKEDKKLYLTPFYNDIVDKAMLPELNIRRGLLLSIITDMPITEDFRTDLFDFCLNGMCDRKESDSSRSVMIKLAAKVCKHFPELKNELIAYLEYLSEETKPSIASATRNALKELKKK